MKRVRSGSNQQACELLEGRTLQVMAACSFTGRAVFADLEITDHTRQSWRMQPNRKIMPTRWTISRPDGAVAMQVEQKVAGKLANPLYKVALTLLDADGRELFQVVDPRTNIPDRLVGLGPDEWAVLAESGLAGKIGWLPKPEREPGWKGFLTHILGSADRGLASVDNEPVLPAPIALGMLLLFEAFTDSSSD